MQYSGEEIVERKYNQLLYGAIHKNNTTKDWFMTYSSNILDIIDKAAAMLP